MLKRLGVLFAGTVDGSARNALEDESQSCMTRANESGRAQVDAGGCTLLVL